MSTTPPPEGPGRIRPFADWLREHNRGATHDEMSDTLQRLVARVKDTGRAGTIVLAIKVEPMKKADGDMVLVTDKITAKLPEHDRAAAYWFIDAENNLVRDDPRQMSFDSLVVVESPTGDLESVNPTTGEVTAVPDRAKEA